MHSEDGARPLGLGSLPLRPIPLFPPVEKCPSPRSQVCRGRPWCEVGQIWGFLHFPQA